MDGALVAREILVVEGAFQHVRDGFLTAVRVIGEPGAGRHGEVVEHQKGRKVPQFRRADGASNARANTLRLFDGKKSLPDRSWLRHRCRRGVKGGSPG